MSWLEGHQNHESSIKYALRYKTLTKNYYIIYVSSMSNFISFPKWFDANFIIATKR